MSGDKSVITVPVLAAADPSKYADAADGLQRIADEVGRVAAGFGDKVLGPLPAAWSGGAAQAALAALGRTAQDVEAAHTYLTRFIGLLREAAQAITEAQAYLTAGTSLAASLDLVVLPDGDLQPKQGTTMSPECTDQSEQARALIQRAIATAEAVNDPIAEAMEDPEQFAGAHAAAGGTAAAQWVADAGAQSKAASALEAQLQSTILPLKGTPPAQVAAWWKALPASAQTELVDTMPGAIGTMPGIPAPVRDTANRRLLAADVEQQQALQASLLAQQAKVEGEMAQLEAQRAAYTPGDSRAGTLPTAAMLALQHQLGLVRSRLATADFHLSGLQSVQQALAAHPAPSRGTNEDPAAYLLSFDIQGQGHSVISLGDPDTATDIAINVMGTGTNLTSTAGNLDRAFAIQQSAQHDANGTGGAASVASILWQGYTAPTPVEAPFQRYANAAAPLLADFERQIAQVNPSSHITVIGHSYGSTVVGEAAADYGMQAGDLVFIGSPGVGVNHASQLNMSPDHVWAGDADDDPVPWSPSVNPTHWEPADPAERFGIDPTSTAFGGQRFKVAPGPGYFTTSVHSDYWQGASLANMADIVAGRYDLVQHTAEGPE